MASTSFYRPQWLGAAFSQQPAVLCSHLDSRRPHSTTPSRVQRGFSKRTLAAASARMCRGLVPLRIRSVRLRRRGAHTRARLLPRSCGHTNGVSEVVKLQLQYVSAQRRGPTEICPHDDMRTHTPTGEPGLNDQQPPSYTR